MIERIIPDFDQEFLFTLLCLRPKMRDINPRITPNAGINRENIMLRIPRLTEVTPRLLPSFTLSFTIIFRGKRVL